MRILFVGPYAGELGWELCAWNPFARHASRDFDRVVVAAPASSRYLYEFAHEFVPVEVVPGTSDFVYGRTVALPEWPDVRPTYRLNPNDGEGALLVDRELARFKAARAPGGVKVCADPFKEWRYLGTDGALGADTIEVCCAFRPPKLFNGRQYADKSYEFAQCVELVKLLDEAGLDRSRIACIGGLDNYHVPGTVDLRGTPLEVQCATLAGAFVAVGPSSGPLHLAHLCRCPVVVWYDRPENEFRGRYDGTWNPFGAGLKYLGRRPTPEQAADAVMEFCS